MLNGSIIEYNRDTLSAIQQKSSWNVLGDLPVGNYVCLAAIQGTEMRVLSRVTRMI